MLTGLELVYIYFFNKSLLLLLLASKFQAWGGKIGPFHPTPGYATEEINWALLLQLGAVLLNLRTSTNYMKKLIIS